MPVELIEIERALDRDDLDSAASLASRALKEGMEDALVYNLSAWRHEQDGEFDKAAIVLREALGRWPEDPSLHLALGIVLRSEGGLQAAVKSFEQAIVLDEGYAAAWFERGATFERGGAGADAAADFRHVLTLEPDNVAAHASLAGNLARRGDHAAATDHAQAALRLEPSNANARIALSVIAVEQKRFGDAIALLEPIKGDDDDEREQVIGILTLLGDAYEGAGRYDDAFTAYSRGQYLFRHIHGKRTDADPDGSLTFVEGIGDVFAEADPAAWRRPATLPDVPPATHVFLTGYPRSGTTLVENILASLPGAVAIEERPTLSMIDRSYLREPIGLLRFVALPEPDLATLRDAYWEKTTAAAGEPLQDRLFVDMDPFKGMRLPIIAKLFPGAKIIIMRRDPRDVVWSCFHTNFAYNAGTLAFSTLESTARHYSLTQRIIDQSLARLPLDAFELRYERLVREFDDTTRQLCAFLDVPWTEALRTFDRTARNRGVSTASQTQVRRGLYDGSGGWKKYAAQLEVVEPILRPWIDRLGYL